MKTPPIVVVMGVSGAGKSVVGACLAERLGAPFVDADALHPPENIAKMSAGLALTDADRAPWLAEVAAVIAGWRDAGTGGVMACSALKRAYRDALSAPGVRLVYLAETPASVEDRLARREGHFMPASLLPSQFAALDAPAPDEEAFTSWPAATPEDRCQAIYAALSGV